MPRSLTQVQSELSLWETAAARVSKGSSYSMNGRTLTMEDSTTIYANIQRLAREETRLLTRQGGGRGHAALANFEDS